MTPSSPSPANASESIGWVESIHISAGLSQPMQALEQVRAKSGVGLDGDRYALGLGHYSGDDRVSRDLTLIEAEVDRPRFGGHVDIRQPSLVLQ